MIDRFEWKKISRYPYFGTAAYSKPYSNNRSAPSPPSILYKYFDRKCLDRVGQNYLDSELVRFTPPIDFNDPYECAPGLNTESAENMMRFGAQDPSNPKIGDLLLMSQAHIEMGLQRVSAQYGAFCMTERVDSTLMWSHYAENHGGFCLGFDTGHPCFSTPDSNFGGLRRINYTNERILLDKNLAVADMIQLFALKGTDWAYEREWRQIRILSEADLIVANIALFKIPFEAVKEVHAGIKASNQTKDRLFAFSERVGARYFETFRSPQTFDLLPLFARRDLREPTNLGPWTA